LHDGGAELAIDREITFKAGNLNSDSINRIVKPPRLSPVRINGTKKHVTLSQPKMLGPIVPALGGGIARRPLALASGRHRAGDSFHAVLIVVPQRWRISHISRFKPLLGWLPGGSICGP